MTASSELLQHQRARHLAGAVERYRADLDGNVVLVTGGARGLGRALVEGLLKTGAVVVAMDRTWSGSEAFRMRLDSHEDNSMALEADITDDAALDSAFSKVIDRLGRVDVLVNNAALVSETLFAPAGHVRLLDTKDSDWEAMFNVNVFGTIKVIRRFVVPMLEAKRGSIINVVSSGILMTSTGGAYYGARPWTTEMPYQATKAALTTASFYLAQEVLPDGVAVNAVMPGHTRTSWFDATARSFRERTAIYSRRPVVADHMLPVTLFLSAQAAAGSPVTGRLFDAAEWNHDHGYGDYRVWLDHDLPDELELDYQRLESALPSSWRAGIAQEPFDARRVRGEVAMERLSSMGNSSPNQ